MAYLKFQLDVQDGWPPASAEGFECPELDGGFRIGLPPLFVNGLSVGDVISATLDDDSRVFEWTHLSRSRNSTVWLLAMKPGAADALIQRLEELGCTVIELAQFNHYSVNVPEHCSVTDLDACLDSVDEELVGRAFPSFRHDSA